MAFTIEVDPDERLGTVVITGVVDAPLILGAIEGLVDHPAWAPGFAALWDFRQTDRVSFDIEDLDRVTGRTRDLGGRIGTGRGAFVLHRELDQDIAAIIFRRVRSEGRERRTFNHVDHALAWLREEPS